MVKWIKITTNMFDDEKIDYIESLPEADSIIVVWIKLLTMAGKCNAKGYIFLTENIPYSEDMLAHRLKRPLNTVRFALETFRRLGMIDVDDKGIFVENWDKHQNIEGLDKIREQTRQRVAKHREQKALSNGECNVTVTQSNAIDIDIEVDKEIDKKKINYAAYVSMKESDYNKLVEQYGEERTHQMIEVLDNYKGSKGKKYKDDYRAILSWVRDEILKKNPLPKQFKEVQEIEPFDYLNEEWS